MLKRLLNNKYLSIVAVLACAIFVIFSATRIFAASDFSYRVDSTYRVLNGTNTRVEEVYSVTNNTSNKYLDKISISAPTEDATNIAVEYADGTPIPFTTVKKETDQDGNKYSYIEINVAFTRQYAGVRNWSFILTYDTTKLVESKGSAHTVTIPSVPQDDDNTYVTKLVVPQDFGTIHTTGVMPKNLGTQQGETTYEFAKKTDLAKSALLVFGDNTVYEVNFKYPLKNPSTAPANFTVTLPPNTSGQQIIVQELNPKPKSTRLDADGNILAEYEVAAKTNVTVNTNIIGVVSYIEYDLAKSGQTSEIPKELVSRYTKPKQYWQSNNPAIVAKARELTAGKPKVSDQLKAINDYVVSHLTYNNEKIKYNIRQGDIKALQNPNNAVCLEYSDLSISLMRAAGIPARMPVGYGYSGGIKQSNSVSDSLHSWVQAYVPNVGWVNIDPTWSEKFDNFGSSDLDHFAFALWGEQDDMPAPVMQAGRDTNYQYENTTIAYKSSFQKPRNDSKLSVSKWVLLPFVAINRFLVTAPSETAGQNYQIRNRVGTTLNYKNIGALAPSQQSVNYQFVFGAMSFGSLSSELLLNGNATIILTTQKTNPTLWPMWLILVTVSGVLLVYMVKLHKAKKDKLTRLNAVPKPTMRSKHSSENSNETLKK